MPLCSTRQIGSAENGQKSILEGSFHSQNQSALKFSSSKEPYQANMFYTKCFDTCFVNRKIKYIMEHQQHTFNIFGQCPYISNVLKVIFGLGKKKSTC